MIAGAAALRRALGCRGRIKVCARAGALAYVENSVVCVRVRCGRTAAVENVSGYLSYLGIAINA